MGVNGSTRNGRRETKCPSARRLEMVLAETGTCNDGATCLWMVDNEEVGSIRTVGGSDGLVYWWFVEGVLSPVAVCEYPHSPTDPNTS